MTKHKTLSACKPNSAWRSWQDAGIEWRKNTWATTEGAMLVAAVAFASQATGENERGARKRAFLEGATHRPA